MDVKGNIVHNKGQPTIHVKGNIAHIPNNHLYYIHGNTLGQLKANII